MGISSIDISDITDIVSILKMPFLNILISFKALVHVRTYHVTDTNPIL